MIHRSGHNTRTRGQLQRYGRTERTGRTVGTKARSRDVPDGLDGRMEQLGRGEEQRLSSYMIQKRGRNKSGQGPHNDTQGMLLKGSLVSWFPGSLVPWFPGSVVQWFPGSLVPWSPSYLVQWFPGSLVLWLSGSRILWFPGFLILVPWFPDSLVS